METNRVKAGGLSRLKWVCVRVGYNLLKYASLE